VISPEETARLECEALGRAYFAKRAEQYMGPDFDEHVELQKALWMAKRLREIKY
jgi:hypothetical protein